MGVYIPNGKIPTTCYGCWAEDGGHCHAGKPKRIRDIDDYVLARTKHPNCPLIEVKEPHGRLIDVDALLIENNMARDCADCPSYQNRVEREKMRYTFCDICDWVDSQLTVIESEGGDGTH